MKLNKQLNLPASQAGAPTVCDGLATMNPPTQAISAACCRARSMEALRQPFIDFHSPSTDLDPDPRPNVNPNPSPLQQDDVLLSRRRSASRAMSVGSDESSEALKRFSSAGSQISLALQVVAARFHTASACALAPAAYQSQIKIDASQPVSLPVRDRFRPVVEAAHEFWLMQSDHRQVLHTVAPLF